MQRARQRCGPTPLLCDLSCETRTAPAGHAVLAVISILKHAPRPAVCVQVTEPLLHWPAGNSDITGSIRDRWCGSMKKRSSTLPAGKTKLNLFLPLLQLDFTTISYIKWYFTRLFGLNLSLFTFNSSRVIIFYTGPESVLLSPAKTLSTYIHRYTYCTYKQILKMYFSLISCLYSVDICLCFLVLALPVVSYLPPSEAAQRKQIIFLIISRPASC